jgi:hypothetical protein
MVKFYEVLGGSEGAILVREGQSLSSTALSQRLEKGAIVSEVEVVGVRLHFKKVSGSGPAEGWVSMKTKDRNLLKETDFQIRGQNILSMEECLRAQELIMKALSGAEMQKRIAQIEKECAGDEAKFNQYIGTLMLEGVYPDVVAALKGKSFKVYQGAKMIWESLSLHSAAPTGESSQRIQLVEQWLEIERLSRNKKRMEDAKALLQQIRPNGSKGLEVPPAREASALVNNLPSDNDREVMNAKGEVIGVEFRGRVRGGCLSSRCPMFCPANSLSRDCRRCSKTSFDHEDLGSAMLGFDEDQIIVRVKGLKVPKSSLDILHVELPQGAQILHLRRAMAKFLKPDAEFLDLAHLALNESDAVPDKVCVSELITPVGAQDALSKVQACEAQDMMIAAIKKDTLQKKIEKMEAESQGNAGKYRVMLAKLLDSEVYPDIAVHFGFQPNQGPLALVKSIQYNSYGNIDMLETWLMLEMMMRNKSAVQLAEDTIKALLHSEVINPGAAAAAGG